MTSTTTNHRVVRRNVSFDRPGEFPHLPLLPSRSMRHRSSRSGFVSLFQRMCRPGARNSTSVSWWKRLLRGICIIVILFFLSVVLKSTLFFRINYGHDRLNIPYINEGFAVLSKSVLTEDPSPIKERREETKTLPGFDTILDRAMHHSNLCQALDPKGGGFNGFDLRSELPFHNDTVASLPSFGIIKAIQSYFDGSSRIDDSSWPTCDIPPPNECAESQLTVVFMAYNPDRLGVTLKEIKRMFDPNIFFNLVKEVILVWNGERHVDESSDGSALILFMNDHPVRIVYPLKMGFPNDLMNRYHPNVVLPSTKAILYYDDDGPFYSYAAIRGGFELWKRHPQAQIGAMARQITYSARQQADKLTLMGTESGQKNVPADDVFISHCTNIDDQVDYQFRFFANYDANMVLPSGSMLHANYLCFLWHPIFAEIRQFVLMHPVHPDDMTVSMIVSQLAGVAPRVYSRRLDRKDQVKKKTHRRRLLEQEEEEDDSDSIGVVPLSEIQRHRSLMFSICWDCGSGMTEMKQFWAELRTEAVNALVRYFGSINSGSIGWCPRSSEYYDVRKDGRCWPVMAKQGMLPWMNPDGTPKDTCP